MYVVAEPQNPENFTYVKAIWPSTLFKILCAREVASFLPDLTGANYAVFLPSGLALEAMLILT